MKNNSQKKIENQLEKHDKHKENKILISVIIPSYNSERFIEKCLSSLLVQKVDFNYEIIVVDSSKDSTPQLIQDKFPNVKLVHFAGQTLPGTARNLGVEQAQGEIIAFLDTDCVAPEDWLATARKNMLGPYSFVGGCVQNGNSHNFVSRADFVLAFNEFMEGMPQREVKFMPTYNFICTKKAFLEVGGFDPNFIVGEDTLFCTKAAEKYKLLFQPELKVAHTNRDSFRAFARHQAGFGTYSVLVRKKVSLPGGFMIKYPLLSFGAPFVRFGRLLIRIIKNNPRALPSFIVSLPLIIVGISIWGWAFVKGAWKR